MNDKIFIFGGSLKSERVNFQVSWLNLRNIDIWELISPNDIIQYQRPDDHTDDFTAEEDLKKIGEVIRVVGTKCLNNSWSANCILYKASGSLHFCV